MFVIRTVGFFCLLFSSYAARSLQTAETDMIFNPKALLVSLFLFGEQGATESYRVAGRGLLGTFGYKSLPKPPRAALRHEIFRVLTWLIDLPDDKSTCMTPANMRDSLESWETPKTDKLPTHLNKHKLEKLLDEALPLLCSMVEANRNGENQLAGDQMTEDAFFRVVLLRPVWGPLTEFMYQTLLDRSGITADELRSLRTPERSEATVESPRSLTLNQSELNLLILLDHKVEIAEGDAELYGWENRKFRREVADMFIEWFSSNRLN